MTTVVVGCDLNSGNDSAVLNATVKALQSAGYQTESLSIGPGPFANYDWHGPSSGKIGVYLMAPSIVSVADAMAHQGFDRVIFGLRGDLGLRGTTEFDTAPWRPDNDCTAVCNKYSGKTGRQIKEMIEPRGTMVIGNSPEELANNVVSAVGGQTGFSQTGSSTGEGQGASDVSPLLQGEMTFEELVGEICNGIDLMFLCKRSTVVVNDFESIFAEAQYLRDKHYSSVSNEDIKLWQLEEDSYELNINQHGFYNTVYVHYKDGTVKESFDDFVKVYGEVPITYKDKKANKTTAQMKAKAYLAAHLRDLEMTVNATILSEPDIDIGDIVTLDNPKTMQNTHKRAKNLQPEFLFVKGVNTSWEGDGYIESDIEMQFSPTSPEKKEVPTAGIKSGCASDGSSSSSSVSGGNWSEYGVSSDGTQIKAIGRPSAAGESSYGYEFYESVFERKCPFCGSSELYWSIFWAGNETTDYGTFPATGKSEGGSAEGHIFCKGCDADFSCLKGADHTNPPRGYLKRISGPTKCTKTDAYNLKKGISTSNTS